MYTHALDILPQSRNLHMDMAGGWKSERPPFFLSLCVSMCRFDSDKTYELVYKIKKWKENEIQT